VGLEQGREAAARARDAELNIAGWCGKQALTAAIAVASSLIRALMAIGTYGRRRLGLDQSLQALAYKFGDEFAGIATAKQLPQLSGGRIRNWHGLVLRLEVVLKPGSQIGPRIAPQGI